MGFRYENRSCGFFSELKYKQQYVGGNISKELTKNQLKTLNLIEQDNRTTINELAKKIGINSIIILPNSEK